jgi:amidophosphoribosyltransferase
MARVLGADSLAYLPLDAVARCVGLPAEKLCRACLTGHYPTAAGEKRYQLSLRGVEDAAEVSRGCPRPSGSEQPATIGG